MSVCATCVCLAPGRPEKDMRSPGVPGGCEPPRGNWETNSGPEQQALLALSCLSILQPGILVWI